MKFIRKIGKGIDSVSEWSGRVAKWLVALLIVAIVYDVFMRYFFNAPTNWSFIVSYMLGSSTIVLGLPYVYYHKSHIRVDTIYLKFSAKFRLLLDLITSILLDLPLLFVLVYIFMPDTIQAYRIGEPAIESTWYPKLWPFKMVISLGLCLALLQSIVIFVRDINSLSRGNK
jgi:TRAP-type mannitol/chloroaromatic compound transport system permease small subunit